MNFPFIAGVVYLCGATALVGAPLDDKTRAFEEALKNSPPAASGPDATLPPSRRVLTVQTLEMLVQQGGAGSHNGEIEQLVVQLMATHPSEQVQHLGDDLVQALEADRKNRADAFEEKANAILAKLPDVITQAKKASDLDDALKQLQSLQNPSRDVAPELANRITQTFQFVTQWQDYLSATGSGNAQEAQNSLRNILNSRQIDAPTFFPRSELLDRLEEASGRKPVVAATAPGSIANDPDVLLAKIQKPGDFSDVLPQLRQVPSPNPDAPWDWSELIDLDKARVNAEAGLPVVIDLKKARDGPVWGAEVSRIVAMELLAILPHYFGTETSDPPKAGESVADYLDRLGEMARASGNLAVLQRVIGVKISLAGGDKTMSPVGLDVFPYKGTQEFLAGLSQESAGEYAQAVGSYESALKDPDGFLPVKIVGERLQAIQTAHPDEFQKGFNDFITPPPVDPFHRYMQQPGWVQPGQFGAPPGRPTYVLPIPATISIPATRPPPVDTTSAKAVPSPTSK